MNLYPEIAKMLGVPSGKKFNILTDDGKILVKEPYWIDGKGVHNNGLPIQIHEDSFLLHNLLMGKYKVVPWKDEAGNKELRLCYIDHDTNIMYFTDDFDEAWGDDWNDAPYEDNADQPYEEYVKARLAFVLPQTGDKYFIKPNGRDVSVKEINAGAAPWIWAISAESIDSGTDYGKINSTSSLMGGATMEEVILWLRKAGCQWAELHN